MARLDKISFMPGAAGERALLARLAAGDDAAYRECYELHAPGLMRLLVRVLRNAALAEEILQETFVAAFRHVGRFRGETRLAAWLAGIALRRALNERRGEIRREKHAPLSCPEVAPSPEPWLAERDLARRVLSILDAMDEPKRLVLLLQAEGYTASEIAEITGEPRGTILSRISRSRAELAERLAAASLQGAAKHLEKERGS